MSNPTTPAHDCWCRNCDKAAKASLSPLAAMRLGSRLIVCPDCGNKRCPRGTNHQLACTKSNEPGQKGSEWEHALGFTALPAPNKTSAEYQILPDGTHSVDTGVGRTVFAAPAPPAPELLSAEASRFLWVDCKPDEYSAILAAFRPLKQLHKWPMEKAYAAILTRFKQGNAVLTARAEAAEEVAQQVKRGLEKAEAAYMAARELEEARTRWAEARAAEAEAQVAMLKTELAEQEVDKLAIVKELKAIRNNGRYPLCVVCQNGPALCECNPGPPTKKGSVCR